VKGSLQFFGIIQRNWHARVEPVISCREMLKVFLRKPEGISKGILAAENKKKTKYFCHFYQICAEIVAEFGFNKKQMK